jgi:hypothetical protein
MSANLDLVRSIYADWERGELRRVEWADPAIELVVVGGVEPGRWRGIEGMALAVRHTLSGMQDWRNAAEHYRELGDGRVFVLDAYRARGGSSGLSVGAAAARLFEIRDGP